MIRKHDNQIVRRQPTSPHDDIIDAEFVEIEPEVVRPAPAKTTSAAEKRPGCLKIGGVIAVVAVGLAIVGLSFSGSSSNSSEGNGADSSVGGQASSDEPGVDNVMDAPSAGMPDLLLNNDVRACSHPENIDPIRRAILSDLTFSPWPQISLAQYRRVAANAALKLTEITAAGINKDTHEVSCEARLVYEGGSQIITFQIRPDLTDDSAAIFVLNPTPGLLDEILRPTIMAINRANEASAENAKARPEPGGRDARPSPVASPTDKNLYEPR